MCLWLKYLRIFKKYQAFERYFLVLHNLALMEIWASFRAKFQDELKILSKASAKSDIYSIYCNPGRSIQRVGAY